jgi:hypothetical protein
LPSFPVVFTFAASNYQKIKMKAEEFFTNVSQSYKSLLSSAGSSAPCLRDYCRSRHVSYPDFVRWASVNDAASGLLSTEGDKKRIRKGKSCDGSFDSSNLSSNHSEADVAGKPLLHPLHILSDSCDGRDESEVTPSILRGIRIAYPNGVKISVSEADSRGLYFLVHGH